MAEEKEKKSGKKVNIRLIIIIAAALLLLAAIAVVAYMIVTGGFGAAINAITGAGNVEYYYEHQGKTLYGAVGRGFSKADGSSLRIWNERGEEVSTTLLSFSQPELCVSDAWAVAWDLGGTDAIVFTDTGIKFRVSVETRLIGVSVNSSGYVAVCAEELGYGGAVTVYNPNGRAIYKAYSGRKYVLSAKVRDNSELLVLSLGEKESEITLYRLSEEEAKARYSLGGVIYDADFNDTGVTVITGEKMIFLSRSLEERASRSFDGRHLADYRICPDFTVALTSEYQVGGSWKINVTGNDGAVVAEAEIAGEVQSIEVGDRAVSVLTAGNISLMTYRLEEKESFVPPAGTERALLRDDATLIAVGPYSAKVIIIEDK